MSGAYQVKQATTGEIHVDLSGSLDEELAANVEREVLRLVAELSPGLFSVVFLTGKVTECSINARPVLVRLQQALAGRARRTAYLDDRPRFRGLALWVMHVAEDPNARAVATSVALRQWLESDVGRVQRAQALAEGTP